MRIDCPVCGATAIEHGGPYHAGFSSRGFLYNDTRAAILTFSSYNPNYMKVVGDKHPWMLVDAERKRLERAIWPDPKGGFFRFHAHPRCPACQTELVDLLQDDIHYIKLGDELDGDELGVWLV